MAFLQQLEEAQGRADTGRALAPTVAMPHLVKNPPPADVGPSSLAPDEKHLPGPSTSFSTSAGQSGSGGSSSSSASFPHRPRTVVHLASSSASAPGEFDGDPVPKIKQVFEHITDRVTALHALTAEPDRPAGEEDPHDYEQPSGAGATSCTTSSAVNPAQSQTNFYFLSDSDIMSKLLGEDATDEGPSVAEKEKHQDERTEEEESAPQEEQVQGTTSMAVTSSPPPLVARHCAPFLEKMCYFSYLPEKIKKALKDEDVTGLPEGTKFTLHSEEVLPNFVYQFVLWKHDRRHVRMGWNWMHRNYDRVCRTKGKKDETTLPLWLKPHLLQQMDTANHNPQKKLNALLERLNQWWDEREREMDSILEEVKIGLTIHLRHLEQNRIRDLELSRRAARDGGRRAARAVLPDGSFDTELNDELRFESDVELSPDSLRRAEEEEKILQIIIRKRDKRQGDVADEAEEETRRHDLPDERSSGGGVGAVAAASKFSGKKNVRIQISPMDDDGDHDAHDDEAKKGVVVRDVRANQGPKKAAARARSASRRTSSPEKMILPNHKKLANRLGSRATSEEQQEAILERRFAQLNKKVLGTATGSDDFDGDVNYLSDFLATTAATTQHGAKAAKQGGGGTTSRGAAGDPSNLKQSILDNIANNAQPLGEAAKEMTAAPSSTTTTSKATTTQGDKKLRALYKNFRKMQNTLEVAFADTANSALNSNSTAVGPNKAKEVLLQMNNKKLLGGAPSAGSAVRKGSRPSRKAGGVPGLLTTSGVGGGSTSQCQLAPALSPSPKQGRSASDELYFCGVPLERNERGGETSKSPPKTTTSKRSDELRRKPNLNTNQALKTASVAERIAEAHQAVAQSVAANGLQFPRTAAGMLFYPEENNSHSYGGNSSSEQDKDHSSSSLLAGGSNNIYEEEDYSSWLSNEEVGSFVDEFVRKKFGSGDENKQVIRKFDAFHAAVLTIKSEIGTNLQLELQGQWAWL